jgi:carboxypeptidase PM20D1
LLKLSPVLGIFFDKIMSIALPEINALSRTIGAVTMISGGTAANIIPEKVSATGNFRILSGETSEQTLNTIKKILRGLDVEIKASKTAEPSKVSKTDGKGFEVLCAAINKTWGEYNLPSMSPAFTCGGLPDSSSAGDFKLPADGVELSLNKETVNCKSGAVGVIPYLMLAGSDSRSYGNISDGIYRFTPMRMTEKDREMIHGINESISFDDLHKMIEFYINLLT